MKTIKHLKLFIASPGDVIEERDLIEKLVKNLSSKYIERFTCSVEAKRWEKHAPITSGTSPQELINEELVNKCDILVGIFYTRFGSPTKNAESGTVEEIEYFIMNNKPVLLYFIDKATNLSNVDVDGYKSILDFRTKYQDKGIYSVVKNIDELKERFEMDLEYNVKRVIELSKSENNINESNYTREINYREDSNDWYKQSIKSLIDGYMDLQGLPELIYSRNITFNENLKLWRSENDTPYIDNMALRAREHAFDMKYGAYDYSNDLRSLYPNWYKPIRERLITHFKSLNNLSVLGVAVNNGDELMQIFKKEDKVSLSAIDICDRAVKLGRKKYKKAISFKHGNMEEIAMKAQLFDVYVNLRSIHSSGVDIKETLAESYRLLKPGGYAIISISNGYINEDENGLCVIEGMYSHRDRNFSHNRPYKLATKVRGKLVDYKFINTGISTLDTEILVWGAKEKI